MTIIAIHKATVYTHSLKTPTNLQPTYHLNQYTLHSTYKDKIHNQSNNPHVENPHQNAYNAHTRSTTNLHAKIYNPTHTTQDFEGRLNDPKIHSEKEPRTTMPEVPPRSPTARGGRRRVRATSCLRLGERTSRSPPAGVVVVRPEGREKVRARVRRSGRPGGTFDRELRKVSVDRRGSDVTDG